MANQELQKLKLLEILKLLQRESDREHHLKCDEILAHLNQIGIPGARKSVYTDIEILKQAGFAVQSNRNQGYWIERRRYTMAQLKLLSDAVDSLSILSETQARNLRDALKEECSVYQQPLLNAPVKSTVKPELAVDILANIDQILKALRENVEIEFRYFDITVHKQKKYRRQSQSYRLFPYALMRDNERYYCVCYSFHHQGFSHYRLDKMEHIRILKQPQARIPFDLEEYASRSFGMYSTPPTNMTLRFDLSLANTVFDRFGQDVMITRITAENFDVNLSLSVAPPFLGWLFQFGDRVKIMSPESLKEEMKNAALAVLRQLET